MNPLSLPGPAFLALWLVLLAPVALGVMAIRRRLGRSAIARDPADVARRLHATEIAYLVGDVGRAVEAAVVALEHRGLVEIVGTLVKRANEPGKVLEKRGAYRGIVVDEQLADAEQYVLSSLPATIDDLIAAPALDEQLRVKLTARDLLVEPSPGKWWAVWCLPLGWFALGATKLFVGVANDRPVFFLMMGLGAAIAFKPRSIAIPRRTELGQAVVDTLQTSNLGLEATASTAPYAVSGTDMALAYALFGPAILAAPMQVLMPTFLASRSQGGIDGGGGGGCGSSCGGGGGCGGGCGGCS